MNWLAVRCVCAYNVSMETWQTIRIAPDYEVSSLGRVRRATPDKYGRRQKVLSQSPCGRTGYPRVNLFVDGRHIVRYVHPLVCEAFHGPKPTAKHQAAHYDGSKDNNAAENLRWATPWENSQDSIRHGTRPKGDEHPARKRPEIVRRGDRHWSRMKPEKVARGDANGMRTEEGRARAEAIRAATGSGKEIAARFGVSRSLVSEIRSGKIWT